MSLNLREKWRKELRGNILPMCTPFNDDYSLNLKEFRRHIQYLMAHGINKTNGIILVSGAAGEHHSLSFDERQALLETALEEVNGKINILFGATATHTMEALKLTKMAEKVGAAGVQMSNPYYEAPTVNDFKDFYKTLNDNVGIGMMVYNTFSKSGWSLYDYRLTEFLITLPRIAGLKHCANGQFLYDAIYVDFAKEIPIYDNHVEEVFGVMMGAIGFTSHIPVFWPEYGIKLWNLLEEKKYMEAQELVNKVRLPFYKLYVEGSEHSSGDGIIDRVACKLMGLNVGPSRKPILPCPPELAEKMKQTMIKFGALKPDGSPSNN